MKGRKKRGGKSPAGKVGRRPDGKAAPGRFAPIIEELGRIKNRLESDASYLSTAPLSLQQRTQIEIEGELLRKEEDVRLDFGKAFRQRPQVLVEMVSALRRYGDADVLRNLVFAAETLYGDRLRELPGGIEFWEDLKREVAPLPHPPALTPGDLRLQRLQAIEIFREAIVSYDMLSDSVEGETAGAPSVEPAPPATTPTGPAVEAPDGDGPDATAGGPGDGASAAGSPPDAAAGPEVAPGPAEEAGPSLAPANAGAVASSAPETVPEPDIAEAPPPPTPEPPSPGGNGEGPVPEEDSLRLDRMMERVRRQELALKKDSEELVGREHRLMALEGSLEEKERSLLAAEEEAGKALAGRDEELANLRQREAALAAELERTRELQRQTAARLENEHADMERLRTELRSESEERLREAERELSDRRARLDERERALSGTERALREQESRLEEERRLFEAGKVRDALPAMSTSPRPASSAPAAPPAPPGPAPTPPGPEAAEAAPQANAPNQPEPSPPLPAALLPEPSPPVDAAPTPDRSPPVPPASSPSAVPEASILDRLARLAATAPKEAAPVDPALVPPPADLPATVSAGPERKVLYKVKCPGCKTIIPVYTRERPLKIKCESCGKEGVLK